MGAIFLCVLKKAQPDDMQMKLYLLRQAFIHNNVNSSMYIDLKTFLAILRNVPLWNANNYDITQHQNKRFIDLFNMANYSVFFEQNDDPKINFTQLCLTLCVNDEDRRAVAIQVS